MKIKFEELRVPSAERMPVVKQKGCYGRVLVWSNPAGNGEAVEVLLGINGKRWLMGYSILYNGYRKQAEIGGSYYYFHTKEDAMLYGLSCIEHTLTQYAGLPDDDPVVKTVCKSMTSLQVDNRILGTMQ